MARLKTFITSDGLTDFVVAATSRPKALAAWGVHQDLFASGQAREVDDVTLRSEAEKAPGQVLERPAGGREKLARMKPPPKAKPGPDKAALKKVNVAVADLKALEDEWAGRVGAIEAQIADLETRRAEEDERFRARKAQLEARLAAARGALRP